LGAGPGAGGPGGAAYPGRLLLLQPRHPLLLLLLLQLPRRHAQRQLQQPEARAHRQRVHAEQRGVSQRALQRVQQQRGSRVALLPAPAAAAGPQLQQVAQPEVVRHERRGGPRVVLLLGLLLGRVGRVPRLAEQALAAVQAGAPGAAQARQQRQVQLGAGCADPGPRKDGHLGGGKAVVREAACGRQAGRVQGESRRSATPQQQPGGQAPSQAACAPPPLPPLPPLPTCIISGLKLDSGTVQTWCSSCCTAGPGGQPAAAEPGTASSAATAR
jgi:hypothetical protein